MNPKFKELDINSLLYLLEDCLLRIKHSPQNLSYKFVEEQAERALEIQKEIKFRTGEVTNLQ